MVFDDRLERDFEKDDDVLDVAEEIVDELAEDHAPNDFCKYCIAETPLARTNARDIPKANKVKSLVENVCELVSKQEYVVSNIIENEYINHYYDSCGRPEDCEICNNQTDECGHERVGETCPV